MDAVTPWLAVVVAVVVVGGVAWWLRPREGLLQIVQRDDAEVLRLRLANLPPETVHTTLPSGVTLLHEAANAGAARAARVLLDAGADVDEADDFGVSALHFAASAGHAGVVSLLIERGAAVDVKDAHGSTPLDVATQVGRTDVAAVLRAAGARPGAEFRMAEVLATWSPERRARYRIPQAWGMRTDDPRLVAAWARARACSRHLDEALVEGRPTLVKWSLEGDGGSEAVWGEVIGNWLEDDLMVELTTPPASFPAPAGPILVPRAAVVDWQVRREDGVAVGGFTMQATCDAIRDEFGTLPATLQAESDAFVDPGP